MVKISICIPTYNRAHYLERCLESVLVSQDPNIEIVVQDNCSPDNTRQLVESFKDGRLRYFRNQTNIGLAKNIIEVIKNASGEYIFYLTDDDFLLPGGMKKIRTFIDKYKPIFFTSDLIMYLEQQKKAVSYNFFPDSIVCSPDQKDEMARIIMSSHILSRVCFNKTQLDYECLKKQGDHWYPQILIGLMLNDKAPIAYLSEPIVLHAWENETFWGIQNSEINKLNEGIVEIIKIASSGLDYEMLERTIYHFSLSHLFCSEALTCLLKAADKKNIERQIRKQKVIKYFFDRTRQLYKLLRGA